MVIKNVSLDIVCGITSKLPAAVALCLLILLWQFFMSERGSSGVYAAVSGFR